MTPQEAIAKLRALSEDQQRAVLSQLSPDERKGIIAQLQTPDAETRPAGLPAGVELPGVPKAPAPQMNHLITPQTIGSGFIHTIPSMLAHPLQTVAAMGQPFAASGVSPGGYPAFAPAMPGQVRPGLPVQMEAQQGQKEAAQSIKENPGYALGGLASMVAAGSVLPKVASLGNAAGSALRTAAIGDPDIAALQGLRIPASSPKSLGTLRAVQGARPFLQGVESQADLQARVPAAKSEIWGPYQETVEAISGKKVQGPAGPTTVGELEAERQQLSALNRGLKQQNPEAIQLAQQKGMTQAQLLAQEKAVQRALDPHLEEAGIQPQAIRQTFGQVAQIGQRVSGKSTLAEKPAPFGFGKIASFDIKHPLQAPAQVASGIRDIVAGRPLWSGSATDVGLREAFRSAGPKPNFGAYKPGASPLELEANVPGNAGYGEDFTKGGFPSAPARAGQEPPQFLRLPSESSPGEAQPMLGVPKHPGAMRSFEPTTERISARPQFLRPETAPPVSGMVTPEGVRIAPRGLLQGKQEAIAPPEATKNPIYPAGSAFRDLPLESPIYPPGSAFRTKIPPFNLDEYLKGQQ